MIKLIRKVSDNKQLVEQLFSLLLLFLPFGSYILSFSIGFMTVYPYLVILSFLTIIGIFHYSKINSKIEKWYLIFLAFWLIYALAYLPFVDGIKEAVVDIRSIILMTMTSFVFIITEKLIGFDRWREILLRMSKLFFLLIFLFAIFEMSAGIHFVGNFTHKIVDRGIVDQLVYTPIFLWDNPNNLIVYLLLVSMIIILLEPQSKHKKWIRWFLLLSCFLVSYISYSRIGNFIIFSLATGFAIKDILELYQTKAKKFITYGALMLLIVLVVFVKEEKYFGPMWEENKGSSISDEMQEVIAMDHFDRNIKRDHFQDSTTYSSTTIRLSLIKNGIDFTKRSYFLGVGPGQFRYLELIDDKPYYTSTVVGAHFWMMELLSQYGVLIFIPYLFFLGWIFFITITKRKIIGPMAFKMILALIVFIGVSVMPSGFLILDINWIFTVTLIVLVGHITNAKMKVD